MLQIDPLKNSCSQKLKHSERKLRLKVFQKSSSLEKEAVPKVALASANVYNCSAKKFTILMSNCNCCEIVKLTHSLWKTGIAASAFVHLTQYFSNKITATSAIE